MAIKKVSAMQFGATKVYTQVSGVGRWVVVALVLTLAACGGSGGGNDGSVSSGSRSSVAEPPSSASSSSASSVSSDSSSSSVLSSSSSSFSSLQDSVQITGTVSYDYVPVSKTAGLDYAATVAKAVRLARVNLVNQVGSVIATSQTDESGRYTLQAPTNTEVKVQVEALSFADAAAQWEVRVEDNTAGDALYVLEGQLRTSGAVNSQRDLHAASGWTGSGYTEPRAAAPFAIMDTAYQSIQKLVDVDANLALPPSVFRWSVNNSGASGDLPAGDIGTSFYNGEAVYILGQEDSDTDEYDAHVVAHEWGHFLEFQVGRRADSIGGSHQGTDKLDMRVAYSEGFANAIAGYVLADPEYRDTSGVGQRFGSGFDINRKNVSNPGWYSESSIQSIFYHLAESGAFAQIYGVLSDSLYVANSAFMTIFSFADIMQTRYPSVFLRLDDLMDEQRIDSRDQYGAGETNNGDTEDVLPLYIDVVADGSIVTVCSTQENGTDNKLGVHAFLKTTAFTSGRYQLNVKNNGDRAEATDPDVMVQRGGQLWRGTSAMVDQEVVDLNLQSGSTYVISVYDYNTHSGVQQADYQPACFDVSLTPQ